MDIILNSFNIFNTREQALGIWIIVSTIAIFSIKSIRKNALPLLKAFFDYKIQSMIFLMLLYVSSLVGLFYILKLWTVELTKDTILWFLFVGLVTLFKINKIRNDKTYYIASIKENFKWTTILEFLTGLYSYSLFKELIIVPIGILIIGMLSFSESNSKYHKVQKLLNGILTLAGLFAVVYSIYQIFTHFGDFATMLNLREFFLGPLLSFAFLPFIYVLSVYMNYEIQFVILKMRIKSANLYKYAKWKSVLNFRQDTDLLTRWVKQFNFENDGSREHIQQSIQETKERKKIERNPPIIDQSKGWSPFLAIKFLESEKISVGYYERYFENEWHASSISLNLDNDAWTCNSISYYITGDDKIAKKLELIFKVFSPERYLNDIDKFTNIANELSHKSLGIPMPPKMRLAILKQKKSNIEVNGSKFSIEKQPWMNTVGSFDLFFTISKK